MVIVHSVEKVDHGELPIGLLVIGRGKEDTILSLLTQGGRRKLSKFDSRSPLQMNGLRIGDAVRRSASLAQGRKGS